MFLRFITRKKDGKEHRYYSVVENIRLPGHRSSFQKTLLYLGELSDAQCAAWTKVVTVFDDATGQLQNLSLFAQDRPIPSDLATTALSMRIADYRLCRPRQYGAYWLSNSHYVGQTSGLPVAVPLAPQGIENFMRRQTSVFSLSCSN